MFSVALREIKADCLAFHMSFVECALSYSTILFRCAFVAVFAFRVPPNWRSRFSTSGISFAIISWTLALSSGNDEYSNILDESGWRR